MPENKYIHDNGCKEAVCIDAGRVYDSCSDKDCVEDMRVYFTERDQMVIDHATNIRAKKVEVITTKIDVEALPFNRGYYSCDLTFFFQVELEICACHGAPGSVLYGIGVFQKKVILFGSEGSVKVFSSEFMQDCDDFQDMCGRNLPQCVVQIAEPVVLGCRLMECCDCRKCECGCTGLGLGGVCIPECIRNRFGNFYDGCDGKVVLLTIGIFSIVQLIRNVQMLVPVYDFCLPSKECCPTTSDNPCDLFRKMCFPTGEFFPPADDKGGCGCEKK